MHLMMPHSHHRGHFIVPTKGKGKGEEPVVTAWPAPSDLHIASPSKSTRRPNFSQLGFAQPQPTQGSSQTSNNPALAEVNLRNENHSSNTWTSSSENPDLASEEDRKDDREQFILEYNRLAQRNTIRPLVPGDFSLTVGRANDSLRSRQSSWLSKMLRQASEQSEQVATKPNKPSMRHQRGLGDVAFNLVNSRKPDGLKNRDLRSLIRLCGKSPLFLPTDYAPFSLTLPTCIRALAQALVQHADTRGIFRVPGSVRVIDALYDYYCTYGDTNSISSTTRCPTLPTHIRCNAHDIASTFKRFLAGLPGGILGSLSLFDALVAIHSQLQSNAELHWTKESKLRARLIALAIGTVRSQYQRELICAVFGLLCLVGRIAENAPREDENGRPLPTTDLMGYNALGIVFGPLLIGDMIDDYSMKVADPSAGLVLLPVSPPRSRKEGHTHRHKPKPARHRHRHRHAKKHTASMAASLTMDKIHIANSITEMLIVHWREVVRQIRSTGSVRTRRNISNSQRPKWVPNNISSSFSENFSLENPHLEVAHSRSASRSTVSPTPTTRTKSSVTVDQRDDVVDEWTPHTRKAGIPNLRPTQKQPMKTAPHLLSPTIEESPSPYVEASELNYGDKRPTDDIASKLSQEAYSISSDTRLERIHDSSSTSRLEMVGDDPIADLGTTILDTVQSRGAPNIETSSPSSPLVQQNTASTTPHWDTAFPGSGQTGDAMIVKASSSPSIKIDQSIPWSDSPTIEVTPQRGYDAETLNSNQATPSDDQTKLFQVDSKNVSIDETRSTHARVNGKVVDSGRSTPLDPSVLHDSRYDTAPGNGYLSKSITDPYMCGRDNSTPIKPPDPSCGVSAIQDRTIHDCKLTMRNPADQWRNLVASSKASTESLAKSAKDRRLKRSSDHVSFRSSGEESASMDHRLATPNRKQQSPREKSQPRDNSTIMKSGGNIISEKDSQSTRQSLRTHVKHSSPNKCLLRTPHGPGSQRSASKPMPGAVKAMTALFDNTKKESPARSAAVSGRTRNSLREPNSSSRRDAMNESSTKSSISRDDISSKGVSANSDNNSPQKRATEALVAKNYTPVPKGSSIVRAAPNRPVVEDTPTKSLRGTLRPVHTFSSARKEPQSSPIKPPHEVDRNQPPRLGTMVPHQEEPPVGHFVRPSSAASAQSRQINSERAAPLDQSDQRHTSGNSLLHAQIRSLQRQLEMKNEETLQLRRQLEMQEHIDIGTLCEQLRFAKRECMTWRKRAEAAEKRVAVFQRFSSKFQALKDEVDDGSPDKGKGVDRGQDEDSSCSIQTESREAFNDRIKHVFAKKMGVGGGDGAVFEDGFGEAGRAGGVRRYELHRGRSRRTVRLWEAAQELFDLQQDGSMRM